MKGKKMLVEENTDHGLSCFDTGFQYLHFNLPKPPKTNSMIACMQTELPIFFPS